MSWWIFNSISSNIEHIKSVADILKLPDNFYCIYRKRFFLTTSLNFK